VGQARALSDDQQIVVLEFLKQRSKSPIRDSAIFLFSVKAGLRAIEISLLEWWMVYDLDGNIGKQIEIPTRITKGGSKKKNAPKPRVIPMHKLLREYLIKLHAIMKPQDRANFKDRIFISQRGYKFDRGKIASLFWLLYKKIGFYKCSSHSGRRTFITNTARKISKCGGSLLEVQEMAGHKSLETTQIYIVANPDAKRKVIDSI